MRKHTWVAALLVGLVCAAPAGADRRADASAGARQVAFQGTFSGRLDILLRPTGFQLVSYAKGRATVLGASVLLGTGPAQTPRPGCWTFQGLASLIGSSGERIYLDFGRQTGCVTRGTTFRYTGTTTVLGGTGKMAAAKGRLRLRSTGDSVTGAISFTFMGTLSY